MIDAIAEILAHAKLNPEVIESAGIKVVRGNDIHFPCGNENGDFTEPLWIASIGAGRRLHGHTPRIAALRCYVSSRLADIPIDVLFTEVS